MVILVDDEDRENEGDLVMAAEMVNPEAINFMAMHGRGLICLSLTPERVEHLQLPMMTTDNTSSFGTAFTISIEAKKGVTTGISAADRSATIHVAIDPKSKPTDLARPGHIFPLKAQKGGVLRRAGQTEGSVDLARLAGLTPAGVICEIMNEDGTMARVPDLVPYCERHGLRMITVADLIEYRSRNESLVQRSSEREIETPWGSFHMVSYRDLAVGSLHMALVHGKPDRKKEALVRVHEPLSIIDLLDAGKGTHSWGVGEALAKIRASGCGVMVLMNCGQDETAPPRAARGIDLRLYGIGAQILRDVGVGRMRLMAAPRKMPSMAGFGLEIIGYAERPGS